MNRKQGIIIVVLLALIATAGVLASRLNSPLISSVPGGDNNNNQGSIISQNNQGNTVNTNSLTVGEFAAAKTERNQAYTETKQTLENVMKDQTVSEQTRQDAESSYLEITLNNEYESKVELALKAIGYQDAVCVISDDKVNVFIKAGTLVKDGVLDEKQAREIKNEVVRITKLVDIFIQVKA